MAALWRLWACTSRPWQPSEGGGLAGGVLSEAGGGDVSMFVAAMAPASVPHAVHHMLLIGLLCLV